MYFIITVDTEGDNLWKIKRCPSGTANITNKNGECIERFQLLCEKYNLIPTYFVNYEMTQSKAFVELGKEALKNKKCEIGMHMHAWNSPPISRLRVTTGHKYGKPYAGEYAKPILYSKMEYLHRELEEIFSVSVTSHRGGRWYFDENILDFLKKKHYLADATVTPGVSWDKMYGNQIPGCNYKSVKMQAYELDCHNILKSGKSGIIEIPPTITMLPMHGLWYGETNMFDKIAKHYWLRPDGNNLKEMLWVMDYAYRTKKEYMEFMIHSSELMQGGSPIFKTQNSIEKLYYDLEIIFAVAAKFCKGVGISEYAKEKLKKVAAKV